MSHAQLTVETNSLKDREATARFFWTLGIVGFFVIQGILWTVAIALTSGDPSHAVIAGYDQRAMHWDQYQAMLRESAALGWNSSLSLEPSDDPMGRETLRVQLVDKALKPISGAQVEVNLFHRARAGEPILAKLEEVSPGSGRYETLVFLTVGGGWQFEISANQGANFFTQTLRQNVVASRRR